MSKYEFSPFPVLENDRLQLREINSTDVNDILALRGNTEAMQWVPRPLMKNIEEAQTFITLLNTNLKNGLGINWAITLKNEDKLIGNICHFNFSLDDNRSEVGYMLLPTYFKQGIMTEALHMVLQYGFEQMNLHSVEAIILEENIASQKVAEKCGLKKSGIFREACLHHDKYRNQLYYDLLKSEYNAP